MTEFFNYVELPFLEDKKNEHVGVYCVPANKNKATDNYNRCSGCLFESDYHCINEEYRRLLGQCKSDLRDDKENAIFVAPSTFKEKYENKATRPVYEEKKITEKGLSIKSRSAKWFEVKIAYEKTNDKGIEKKVKETYSVDALSFTEAEKRITEEMQAYISGDFEVVEEKIAAYNEVFFSDLDMDDKFYKIKLAFITIDAKTEKEKRYYTYYLVQAGTIDTAKKYIDKMMGDTLIDYEVKSVVETSIMDVFEHK